MGFTISTETYGKTLMDWIGENNYAHMVLDMDMYGKRCTVKVDRPDNLSKKLVSLFEDIILAENQVAGAHEKLKSILRGIVFDSGREEMRRVLELYMDQNDEINLEGFVTFRFGEYSSLMNIVLYAAVKKMLY